MSGLIETLRRLGRTRPAPAGPSARILRNLKPLVLLAVAAYALWTPLSSSAYRLNVMTLMLLMAIFTAGLNVMMGYGGLVNFGQAALMGVGAYVTARLMLDTNLPFLLTVVAAVVAASIAGALIGASASRVQGHYFGVVTVFVAQIMVLAMNNWTSLTGGSSGLRGIPLASILGYELRTNRDLYYVALAGAALALGLTWWLRFSYFGRALVAIREDELAARASGVGVPYVKIAGFAVGAGLAGLAGVLQVLFLSYVGPQSFGLGPSILAVQMLIIGGTATTLGPLVGAIVVVGATEVLRPVAEYRVGIFGIVVLLVLIVQPGGIVKLLSLGDRGPRWMRNPLAAGATVRGGTEHAAPALVATSAVDGSVSAAPPLLHVVGVHRDFGGIRAVDGVDLEVKKGEILGLVGPNGSGKTTLVNIISGMTKASSGSVRIGDEEVRARASYRVARRLRIARTFQNIRLCDELTVVENVLVGMHRRFGFRDMLRRRKDRDAVHEALGLLDFVGIRHLAGSQAMDISYGDRRRVEIARALALGPQLLLLDEPAAGMNPSESQALIEVIRRLPTLDLTCVLIEHNMPVVMATADRVVVLDAGRVVAVGLPADIAEDPVVQGVYLGKRRFTTSGPDRRPTRV